MSSAPTNQRKPVAGEKVNDQQFVDICTEQFKHTPMGKSNLPSDSTAARELLEPFAWGVYSGLRIAGVNVDAIHPKDLVTRLNTAIAA